MENIKKSLERLYYYKEHYDNIEKFAKNKYKEYIEKNCTKDASYEYNGFEIISTKEISIKYIFYYRKIKNSAKFIINVLE